MESKGYRIKCISSHDLKINAFNESLTLIPFPLSDNQLGTRRMCQGAKEQALVNQCLNQRNGSNLCSTWIDVKKAFDSVDHEFLDEVLQNSGLPFWIVSFITKLVGKWKIRLNLEGKVLGEIRIRRGILQGDSHSPQIFALLMDPLSRMLNGKFPKVTMGSPGNGEPTYATNHLLFMDDIKLFSHQSDSMVMMMEEVDSFFDAAGLERNFDKSATNVKSLSGKARFLDGLDGYRYLGVLEDKNSNVLKGEIMSKVYGEVSTRIKNLTKTDLNSVNLFKAMNEYAISLYNYYIGLIHIEPGEFERIDKNIRRILMDSHIHLQAANKERLYLPRNKFGRGLESVSNKAERMLLQFYGDLEHKANYCLRRAGILRVINSKKIHMATIVEFISRKYNIENVKDLTMLKLMEIQHEYLLGKIEKKSLHSILFECLKENEVDIAESSGWLVHGNHSPVTEGRLCLLQDRNMFFDNGEAKCKHCNSAKKTVDHLATRCGRMLNSSYLRRHNEVVRCIHLHLCRQYGIRKTKKLKTHSVQSVVSNEFVEIRVDTTISSDTAVQNNKPDIFVHDKMRNTITLVEIGITSQNCLKQVEVEKFHKYDLLANELGCIHRAKVKIIPVVITWDGIVSRFFKGHLDALKLEERVKAYIQTLVLRKTLESMQAEDRHGVSMPDEEEADKECQPRGVSECGVCDNENTPILAIDVGPKKMRLAN